MGAYGIGIERTIATMVETHHDDKGIIWPGSISPFDLHLITLPGGEKKGEELYELLSKKGLDVLWDEREESAGAKFADADLIGIPIRLVVSQKTGGKVEVKERRGKNTTLRSFGELLNYLKAKFSYINI